MSRQARLVYELPDGGNREVALEPDKETTIGRHPACTISVAQPSVSRRHARLWFEAGGFYVEDLGSSNGSYVNNQRVTRASMADGDELRCGDFKMQYSEGASGTREVPAAAVAAPAPVPDTAASVKPRVVGTLRPRRSGRAAPAGRTPATETPAPRPRGRSAPVPASARPSGRVSRDAPAPAGNGDEVAKLRARLAELESKSSGATDTAKALDSAKSKVESLEAKIAELVSDNSAGVRDLGDLKSDVEARARRIRELESEQLRAEEQLTTLTDRSLHLKEQVQSQQEQLEEYRREKIELEVRVAELKQRVDELRGAHDASGEREVDLAQEVNDLKREVRQKDKAIREIERQLDLAEYNLKAARDENENLRLALGEDDENRSGLNTTIEHLRQVLAEKEAMIERLHTDVGRWQDKAAQAADQAADDAGGAATQLQTQLNAVQAERAEANRRADMAAAEVAELRRQSAEARSPNRQQVEQLNELKRANRDLRNQVEASSANSIDQVALAEMQTEQRRWQQRAESAEAALAAAPAAAPAASGGGGGLTVEDAGGIYRELNDLASDLRMNVEVAGGYVKDLVALVDLVVKMDYDSLPPTVGNALRAAVEQADAAVTIESADEALDQATSSTRAFKKLMRRFRELLTSHGFGG